MITIHSQRNSYPEILSTHVQYFRTASRFPRISVSLTRCLLSYRIRSAAGKIEAMAATIKYETGNIRATG